MENTVSFVGRITHNLAEERHFDFIAQTLGGEKRLRQKYPELYSILLYTQEKARKHAQVWGEHGMLSARAANTGEYTYGLKDSMKIRTLNYDPFTTVETVSDIRMRDENPSLIITGELQDITNNKTIDQFAVYENDSRLLEGRIEYDSRHLIRGDEYEFLAQSTFSRILYDEDGKPYYQSVTEKTAAQKVMSAQTLVKKIEVIDPMPVKHPGADKTHVYYNNRQGDGCDYYFNNVKATSEDVLVYLPFKGSVEFDSHFRPLYADKNRDFMLQIENLNKGTANFNTAHWNEIQWDLNGSVLSWKFPDCWYHILQKDNFSLEAEVDFYCKMNIIMEGGIAVPIVISSADASHRDPSFHTIRKIKMEWGCLAEGTNIKMSDGSMCQIQNITVGDAVMTAGGPAKVAELITGMEQLMVVLGTSRGHEIRLTKDHPVLTEGGWKRAGDLNAADILSMEDGPDSIEKLYLSEYNAKVFSIRVDTEESIIAEGFHVGDFGRQNRLGEQRQTKATQPSASKEGFQQALADLIPELEQERKGKCHE